tara:strand:- start:17817 stop:18032 length:216 start_codon:yes stop_codon:yes gene_type:complete
MPLSIVHYQDLTNEGQGVFTFSRCWGEHWSKSMSQLKQDLVHEFGNDYKLIDMESLTDSEFKALEVLYASE